MLNRQVRHIRARRVVAVGAGLALALTAIACKPTGLDKGFDGDGVASVPLSPLSDRLTSITPGPGGTFYAAGHVVVSGNDQALAVARLTADGQLDPTFGTGGHAVVNVAVGGGTAESARSVTVQSDGKVVIAGSAEHDVNATGGDAGDTDMLAARFTVDGEIDRSFGTQGVARIDLGQGLSLGPNISYVGDFAWGVQAVDGDRVVLFGQKRSSPTGVDSDFVFVGLTSTGALDPNFGDYGVVQVDVSSSDLGGGPVSWEYPRNLTLTDDGHLLGTGYSLGGDGVTRPFMVRADTSGQLDTSFSGDGIATATVLPAVAESYKVEVQGDDYILAGYGRSAAGTVDMIIYRFDQDGNLDPTFGVGGLRRIDVAGQDDRARNLTVLPDGRIIVVGSIKPDASNVQGAVVLLSRNGGILPYWNEGEPLQVDLGGPNDAFFGSVLSSDGKYVYLAGYKGGANGANADDAVIARIKL